MNEPRLHSSMTRGQFQLNATGSCRGCHRAADQRHARPFEESFLRSTVNGRNRSPRLFAGGSRRALNSANCSDSSNRALETVQPV